MKKIQKIKKNEEIEAIIKERRTTSSENFVLYTKENHDNKFSRFALSIPKKFGNAVSRNKMKRRIRYIYDQETIKQGYDIFLVIKQKANSLNFESIEKEVKSLFSKSGLLEAKWPSKKH